VGNYNTWFVAPNAVAIYNHFDYVNLLGYAATLYYKHQLRPLPRVESDEEATHGFIPAPTCLYDSKFLPSTDQITVQLGYSGTGSWPVLSLYRCGSVGINDLILQVSDNNIYTIGKYGYQGWSYNEGASHVLAVVRHELPKVFDLSIKSILS
jgi:hypothetical protein